MSALSPATLSVGSWSPLEDVQQPMPRHGNDNERRWVLRECRSGLWGTSAGSRGPTPRLSAIKQPSQDASVPLGHPVAIGMEAILLAWNRVPDLKALSLTCSGLQITATLAFPWCTQQSPSPLTLSSRGMATSTVHARAPRIRRSTVRRIRGNLLTDVPDE